MIQTYISLENNIGTALVFVVVFLSVYLINRKPKGIPPGSPLTLPFIGDLPLLIGGDILNTFAKLRKRYGDIFSFYIGRKLFIVINGYKLIHKSAVKRGWTFSGRPREDFSWETGSEHGGIFMSSGLLWQRQRKFIHNSLEQFGFGKTSFESKILTEVRSFIEYLRSTNGQPCDFKEAVRTSMANVVFSIVCGKRHEYTDSVFRKILRNIHYATRVFLAYTMISNCFPFFSHAYAWIPFDIFHLKKLKAKTDGFRNYVKELYEEHMGHFKCEINDLMDSYIKEEKNTQNKGTRAEFSFDQMFRVMDDLLGAGTEAGSTAVQWAVIYLLNYPEVKQRLQTDINKVVPDARLPSLDDKAKLPYVEAFIMELLRITNIGPLSLPHAVLGDADVVFDGYRIPKDCSILFNFQSVHLDPNNFKDPLAFKPERFLDSLGKVIIPKEFMPFGAGRRLCLGEPVAKMEIFLFLAAMIKEFDFLPEETAKIPSTRPVIGITQAPVSYKVRVVKRRSD